MDGSDSSECDSPKNKSKVDVSDSSECDSPKNKKNFMRKLAPKNMSKLGAKKAVASKIGETKLGRASLVKLMGQEADDIVGSLKAAVSKLDNHAKAKELKKDLFKWVLKVTVLIQNKNFDRKEFEPLVKPITLLIEKIMQACSNPRGERNFSRIVKEKNIVGPLLHNLMEPHSKDTNVNKLDNLFTYYSDEKFLTRLFNEQELVQESDLILDRTKKIMERFPPILNDVVSIQKADKRIKSLEAEIDSKPSIQLMLNKEHPEMCSLFSKYLDSDISSKLESTALRFLLAEQEYSHVNALNLRILRANVILNKYLSPYDAEPLNSSAKVVPGSLSVPPNGRILIYKKYYDEISDILIEKKAPKTIFVQISMELQHDYLPAAFNSFLSSQEFTNYKNTIAIELKDLCEDYRDSINMASESKKKQSNTAFAQMVEESKVGEMRSATTSA